MFVCQKNLTEWMNANEWMNGFNIELICVFHSLMQTFNHSRKS